MLKHFSSWSLTWPHPFIVTKQNWSFQVKFHDNYIGSFSSLLLFLFIICSGDAF